jgi:hypothetical protein
MHQSPRIKPTLINGEDANPKAVENRLAKEVDRWDPPGSAGLGWDWPTWPLARWAPPSVVCLLVSSRVFSTWGRGET